MRLRLIRGFGKAYLEESAFAYACGFLKSRNLIFLLNGDNIGFGYILEIAILALKTWLKNNVAFLIASLTKKFSLFIINLEGDKGVRYEEKGKGYF